MMDTPVVWIDTAQLDSAITSIQAGIDTGIIPTDFNEAIQKTKEVYYLVLKYKDTLEIIAAVMWAALVGIGISRKYYEPMKLANSLRAWNMENYASISMVKILNWNVEIVDINAGKWWDILDIEQGIYLKLINKAETTTPDRIIMNLKKVESSIIYDALARIKNILTLTNHMEISALEEHAENLLKPVKELILEKDFRAYLIRPPVFHTNKDWNVVEKYSWRSWEKKKEVKLMFFPQKDLDTIDKWVETHCSKYSFTHAQLLDKMCQDHRNPKYIDDLLMSDVFITSKSCLTSDPVKRRIFVGMAQAIRAYRYEKNEGLQYTQKIRKPESR